MNTLFKLRLLCAQMMEMQGILARLTAIYGGCAALMPPLYLPRYSDIAYLAIRECGESDATLRFRTCDVDTIPHFNFLIIPNGIQVRYFSNRGCMYKVGE